MIITPMIPHTEWARAQAENQLLDAQARRNTETAAGEENPKRFRFLTQLLPKHQPAVTSEKTICCTGEYVSVTHSR